MNWWVRGLANVVLGARRGIRFEREVLGTIPPTFHTGSNERLRTRNTPLKNSLWYNLITTGKGWITLPSVKPPLWHLGSTHKEKWWIVERRLRKGGPTLKQGLVQVLAPSLKLPFTTLLWGRTCRRRTLVFVQDRGGWGGPCELFGADGPVWRVWRVCGSYWGVQECCNFGMLADWGMRTGNLGNAGSWRWGGMEGTWDCYQVINLIVLFGPYWYESWEWGGLAIGICSISWNSSPRRCISWTLSTQNTHQLRESNWINASAVDMCPPAW